MKKIALIIGLYLISLLSVNAPQIEQRLKDENIVNYILEVKRKKEIERFKTSLAFNNNNPFNIRNNKNNNWQGKLELNESFEAFKTLDHGIRAGIKLLINYQSLYGLKTIEEIIYRFAPPFENNTEHYINWLCENTGHKRDEPINLKNEEILVPFCSYIIQMETGKMIAEKKVEQVYTKYFT